VVLGVDSIDWLLLERWCPKGLLPFFDSMLKGGSQVRLSTVSRVLQGSVWPGVLSGRSPGAHGIYYLTQLTNRTYNLDLVDATHAALNPYYLQLDANGVRCALVDIPNDIPIPDFKGVQVVDWLTEFQFWRCTMQTGGRNIDTRLQTLNAGGGYGPTIPTLEGHRLLRQRLERSIAMKGALTRQLLAQDDLDHIFVVFGEPHKAGHFLWKYMDPAHPDHVAADPYLRDSMLAIYQGLDRELAALAGQLRPNDNLLVFSDHGMQANYRGDHFITPILQRLGLCDPRQTPILEKLPAVASKSASGAANSNAPGAWTRIKHAAKNLAPEGLATYLRHKFGAASLIDWDRTRVFQLPTDRNSYLRVNLKGREPNGIVAPGKEYDEVLSLLEGELRSLINVETGKHAVEDVFRVHKLFPGPHVNDLPDLAVLWSAEVPINSIESPRLGRLDIPEVEERCGNHRAEGFLLAKGPAIRPNMRRLQGDVLQIPSTLLALHGVDIPDHFEMGPLHELLADEFSETPRAA
jgi:predicted AlkP superfamily phosphohydrolase/phosphomutase